MADMTLEEALAAATEDEELVTPVNEVLLINPETRTINVPDSEKLFGARQDMDVERKYFKCPRIVGDNIDLFEHRIFVNYVPSKQDGSYDAKEEVQSYWCGDLAVEGDFVTFSWKLSENVTRSAGYIAFAVYAKTIDEYGNLQTKWHTTIAVGNVLDTLPDGEEWVTVYPDIVMQLLERMDKVEKIATPETLLDRALKDSTKAAPADIVGKLSEDIADIKQNGTGTGNGLTTAQRNSLLAVVNAIGTFNVANGQELIDNFNSAWKITINATGVTLDKTTLTFVESVNQTLVATVEPSDSTDEVMWASSNESIAKVTNGIVTPISNGSCTITATAGSVSASCEVTVNVENAIVTYTVTNNLTNVSTDNPVGTITENSGYTAILTPDTDYEFDTVVVTMGGVDVTSDVYANGTIVISKVTGNVVITAIASEPQSEEVVFLEYLGTDGEAYINTEYIPSSINEKILLGVQYYTHDEHPVENLGNGKGTFFGLSNTFGSGMWDTQIGYSIASNIDSSTHWDYRVLYRNIGFSDTLSTGQHNYDSAKEGLRFTENPIYIYISNGLQALYLDEEMTTQPTGGTFASLSKTLTATKTDENKPLVPCYLGANNYLYGNSVVGCPIKIYCLKVWDGDDNLIVDMHPARQGSTIGMYDNVRQKFFSNASSSGSFTYGEVTA